MSRMLLCVCVLAFFSLTKKGYAAPYYQGEQVCAECHEAESSIWEETKHAQSFGAVHKAEKAGDILKAAGGSPNMKRNSVCTQCHYTMVQSDAQAAPVAKSGPSCERCHGASSDYVKIHNNYGGPNMKAADETPAHKTERLQKAAKAGMQWPSDKYAIAGNCMGCHGLTNPNVDKAILAKMLAAGHPDGSAFELVRYSQGNVRHRFYPPKMTENATLDTPALAQMYMQGQAASLVAASAALLAGGKDATYQKIQTQRMEQAKKALSLFKTSEAKAFASDPNEQTARAFLKSIEKQDVSKTIQSLLPDPKTYKQ